MIEKTGNLKGAGLHWDIVLLSVINLVAGLLGGPFICAATVRANAHATALTVMSTTHAPGEQPKVVEVKDQRLSAFLVSLLTGLSIFLSPLLKHIPYAVLFGVFLYMGISSMNGIQLFDRLILFFIPVKHHPRFNYVRRVSTTHCFLNATKLSKFTKPFAGENMENAFVHNFPVLWTYASVDCQVFPFSFGSSFLCCRHGAF